MASLRRLETCGAKTLYPGHGPHIDTHMAVSAKIAEYIDHRLQREDQILRSLLRHPQGLSAVELVESIYPELPVRAVMAAEQSILAHLSKLEEEGRAVRTAQTTQDLDVWHLSH